MSIVKSPILDQVAIRFREWFPLKKNKEYPVFLKLLKKEDFKLQIKLTRTFAWIFRI